MLFCTILHSDLLWFDHLRLHWGIKVSLAYLADKRQCVSFVCMSDCAYDYVSVRSRWWWCFVLSSFCLKKPGQCSSYISLLSPSSSSSTSSSTLCISLAVSSDNSPPDTLRANLPWPRNGNKKTRHLSSTNENGSMKMFLCQAFVSHWSSICANLVQIVQSLNTTIRKLWDVQDNIWVKPCNFLFHCLADCSVGENLLSTRNLFLDCTERRKRSQTHIYLISVR